MLRILHSLPRTHKLLLLPVATMVTVLGTQKIVTAYQDIQREQQTLGTVLVPLSPDSRPGLPALNVERSPVVNAIELATHTLDATRALDATNTHVPRASFQASEIIDLDLIDDADAASDIPLTLAKRDDIDLGTAETDEADSDASLDDRALQIATIIGDRLLGPDDTLVVDATSYAEVSEEELSLFDEGPIQLVEEIAASEAFVPEWETYTVQQGDAFSAMAQEHLGLGYSEVMKLLGELPDKNVLARWQPGDRFEYQLGEDGKLLTLRMMLNARDGFQVERAGGDFEVATIERTGEPTQRLYAGTVSGSFARSAQATGLTSPEVAQLSQVLEKKLDFRRDTRRGDRFQVLVESDVIDGESFDSRVLAVQYEGASTELTLVRSSADNDFYSPDGESLDPAFNRYPFVGSYRLSSPFNPQRRHPVTGRISPHKGTDFAMPIGTPVQAPADGEVEKVGNHPLAGRYIVVRHDNGYRTRYLHLSRALVSHGQRVSMGERIALSGNTGRSTGPHLHYEVLVNNSAVDAMRVELPENQSLTGERLVAFQREAEPLLATLENGQTGTAVAQTGDDPDDDS